MQVQTFSSYTQHRAVTKANSDLPNGTCAALFIGTGGTLTIRDCNDVDVTWTAATGTILPFCAKQVRTGGTAADIIALYY